MMPLVWRQNSIFVAFFTSIIKVDVKWIWRQNQVCYAIYIVEEMENGHFNAPLVQSSRNEMMLAIDIIQC